MMINTEEKYSLNLTKRQVAVIKFAVYRFQNDALSHANAAAQDLKGNHYKAGSVESFMNEADDCKAILEYLRSLDSPQDAGQDHKPYEKRKGLNHE
jgi:hypothetical protein